MNLQSMKLGTRLGLAFCVVVALTAALAVFALSRLARENATAEHLAERIVPRIRVLAEMRTTANQIRRVEADMLLATEATEIGAMQARIGELKSHLGGRITAYEGMLETDAERASHASFQQLHGAFFATQARLFQMLAGGPTEEAKLLFRGESRTNFNAMAEQIGKMVEQQDQAADAAAADARATYADARLGLLAVTGLSVVLAALLGVLVVRSVTRQLGGEPGDAAALAQRVAEGDLSLPIRVRPGDTASLLAAMRRMQDSLGAVVLNARRNAESVATASAQISQGNTDLSSRTEQQASALQETAASMRELASTVKQNADNADQGNRLALQASEVAARGGEVVGQVVQTMKDINDSSRRIADIIGTIDGIAFQTNILALNAAVEAARAGEQGRGFAVVAGEVRTLAQRSADAAKEIKALIQASVDRVAHGSTLVDQAGATMDEVVESIRRVTDIMGQISTASGEQSVSVAQVGDAVHQMDQVTQQNAALVEQSAAAAGSLKSQAAQLLETVAVFRLSGGESANLAGPVDNVLRPAFGQAPARAALPAPAERSAAPVALARTGTDDWANF